MVDAPAREKITADEYRRLPETNTPMELIDGVIYQMPSPFDPHQVIVGNAYLWGRTTVRRGRWLLSPLDVYLDDLNVVQPDLAWVAPDSACVLVDDRCWQGAPDLVIEVISEATARRDRQTKYELYQRAGVREYWIVDPRDSSIEVFQRADGGFRRVGIFYADDALTSPLLNASLPLQGVLSGT